MKRFMVLALSFIMIVSLNATLPNGASSQARQTPLPFSRVDLPLIVRQPPSTPTQTSTPTSMPTSVSSGPKPGFWKDFINPGRIEFTVTADRTFVHNFAVYIAVTQCGNYKITRTTDVPISGSNFSASGSFRFNGKFSSDSMCSGTWAMTDCYIAGCGYLSVDPVSYVTQWRHAAAEAEDEDAVIVYVQIDRAKPDDGGPVPR